MIINDLQTLKLRSFITSFRVESATLWFLCFYIFIEYIRPHSMYPILDFLPWGQLAIISTLTSIFVTHNKAIRFNSIDKMFIIFTIIVILSVIFAWSTAASLRYWSTYTSWILMYFCILSILTTPNRIFLFVLFFILINFKLSEHGARNFAMRGFSFAHWGLSGPPGWFHNSGEFSMQMMTIFAMSSSIILAAKKHITNSTRWWVLFFMFPGTSALSVIGSSSRGGQIALATIILIMLLSGKHFFRKILLIIMMIYLALYFLPEEQLARFNTMGDDETSQHRLEHWDNAKIVLENNPLGIGYFNWHVYYPAHFDLLRFEEIHNTFLQAFTDLGYQGGGVFLLMIMVGFVMNIKTRREMNRINDIEADMMAAVARGLNLSLLGTCIAASFMSILYYPSFWIVFALISALRSISIQKLKGIKMHQLHYQKNKHTKRATQNRAHTISNQKIT